jgi:hypothetical protein
MIWKKRFSEPILINAYKRSSIALAWSL